MDMHQQIVDFLLTDHRKDGDRALDYDDSLLELGVIDSVKMLDLIGFIEEKYGIKVADEDLLPENFDTVNAIVKYIRSKQ